MFLLKGTRLVNPLLDAVMFECIFARIPSAIRGGIHHKYWRLSSSGISQHNGDLTKVSHLTPQYDSVMTA